MAGSPKGEPEKAHASLDVDDGGDFLLGHDLLIELDSNNEPANPSNVEPCIGMEHQDSSPNPLGSDDERGLQASFRRTAEKRTKGKKGTTRKASSAALGQYLQDRADFDQSNLRSNHLQSKEIGDQEKNNQRLVEDITKERWALRRQIMQVELDTHLANKQAAEYARERNRLDLEKTKLELELLKKKLLYCS